MRLDLDPHRGKVAASALLLLCAAASARASDGALFLGDAQAAAVAAHPALEAIGAEQRARDAARRQAEAIPNPALLLEVENIGGTDDFDGAGEAETTLRLVQPIELGGDRAARTRVAAERRALADFDAIARRLDVLADVTNAFVEVLIAQEELHHAAELLALAREERHVAIEHVRAGGALAVEETRARVVESDAAMHEARGRTRLDTARRSLAVLMGREEPEFAEARGDLERVSAPPSLDALLARLDASPELARFEAERRERDAELALRRAERVPDPAIGAGARYLSGSEDAALVFEVGIPLPLFDRQQASIAEGAERVAKIGMERAAAQRERRRTLIEAHGRWSAAYQEVRAIRDEILPGTQEALRSLRGAWRDGRASQLEVLGARRAEYEAVDRMLHLLGEYHEARVACERMAGAVVEELR